MAPKPNEALRGDLVSIQKAIAVDPLSGDVNVPGGCRAVYVGTTGNLAVQFVSDKDADTVVLVGLAAGMWHPMQVQKILQSGTTADDVVLGY